MLSKNGMKGDENEKGKEKKGNKKNVSCKF